MAEIDVLKEQLRTQHHEHKKPVAAAKPVSVTAVKKVKPAKKKS